MRRLAIVSALLCLSACHVPAAQSPTAPGPHAFSVDVVLSPAAGRKLSSLHETVAVAAYFSGLPTPGVQASADGQVDLGSETVELTPSQTRAAFTGAAVDGSDLKTITGKPHVLINVFSARHVASDNLLDCSIFEDDIAVAQARPPRITCDLIAR